MREIKLKVYNVEGKQIIFSLDEIININHESLTDDEYIFIAASDYLQFTGLADKHGKDIYEGDVIHNPTAGNFLVEFKNGFWGYKSPVAFVPLYDFPTNGCEIIGNIYNNSEPRQLIEQSNQEIR